MSGTQHDKFGRGEGRRGPQHNLINQEINNKHERRGGDDIWWVMGLIPDWQMPP